MVLTLTVFALELFYTRTDFKNLILGSMVELPQLSNAGLVGSIIYADLYGSIKIRLLIPMRIYEDLCGSMQIYADLCGLSHL